MNSYVSSGRLVICLDRRIDSENSPAVSAAIRQTVAAHPGTPVCLDADKLEYITSSGLRILLSLQQEFDDPIVLKNVSPDVLRIMEITGFTSILDVRPKLKEVSLEGCRILGTGAFRTVYRLNGDTVVKVYRGGEETLPMIAAEREQARNAFLLGIPTAIPFDTVKTDEGYGAMFELVDARCLNDLAVDNPGSVPEITKRYAAFLRGLHALTAGKGELPDARERFLGFLERVSPVIDKKTRDVTEKLIRAMPEDLHILHGDAHWKNVMDSDGTLMVIDMDTLCVGDPVFEFAGLYMTYVAFEEDDPGNTMRFHGIDAETSLSIFHGALGNYLGLPDPDAIAKAENSIRLPGLLIYLNTLMLSDPEDKLRRMPRAAARMAEAALHADCLILREPDRKNDPKSV